MGALTFCGCDQNANYFIQTYFHDCAYSTKDVVGFIMGIASIGFWLMCQVPQFISNVRTQKVEALSAWFLAEWLLGDTCNLTGCILTGQQLPTETYTAMYFVLADIVLLMQYTYYTALQHRRKHFKEALQKIEEQRKKRHHHHHHRHHRTSNAQKTTTENHQFSYNDGQQEEGAENNNNNNNNNNKNSNNNNHNNQSGVRDTSLLGVGLLTTGGFLGYFESPWTINSQRSQRVYYHRKLLETLPDVKCQLRNPFWARMLGQAIGYCSSVFYLLGRASQILKNCQRKETEGLAVTMFLFAIFANITYALGILLRLKSQEDLVRTMPWLIGSLGTVGLDICIFIQGIKYKKGPKEKSLLNNNINDNNSTTLPLLGSDQT